MGGPDSPGQSGRHGVRELAGYRGLKRLGLQDPIDLRAAAAAAEAGQPAGREWIGQRAVGRFLTFASPWGWVNGKSGNGLRVRLAPFGAKLSWRYPPLADGCLLPALRSGARDKNSLHGATCRHSVFMANGLGKRVVGACRRGSVPFVSQFSSFRRGRKSQGYK